MNLYGKDSIFVAVIRLFILSYGLPLSFVCSIKKNNEYDNQFKPVCYYRRTWSG